MWLKLGSTVVIGFIVVLVLAECRDTQFRRTWMNDRPRLRRNAAFLAASVLVMSLLRPLGEWLQPLLPHFFAWNGQMALQLLCCFLLAEFAGWALHYVKHHNPFLWTFHFQHHRESHYNLWLSTHTHALEVLVSGLFTAGLLCLAGFSNAAVTVYLLFYTFIKVYQHSSQPYTLGLLDWIIIGPRYHRMHHEVDSRCNYGVSLTLFDVLLRTARWPGPVQSSRPVLYGVDEDQNLPFGFWQEMAYFLDRRRASSGDPLP